MLSKSSTRLRDDDFFIVKPFLEQVKAYQILLPSQATDTRVVTLERVYTLMRNRTCPSMQEMREVLEIVSDEYEYRGDVYSYFRRVVEKSGSDNLIYRYWDILYPDAEPIERSSLVFRHFADKANMTNKEIATLVGTSQPRFSCLYSGSVPISYKMVYSFCHALHLTTEEYFEQLRQPAEVVQARNWCCSYLRQRTEASGKSLGEISSLLGIWKVELESYLSLTRPVSSLMVERFSEILSDFDKELYLEKLSVGKVLAKDYKRKYVKPRAVASSLQSVFETLLSVQYIDLKPADKSHRANALNFATLLYFLLLNDWTHPCIFREQIMLYLRRLSRDKDSIAATLRPGMGETSTDIFVNCIKTSGYTLQALSNKTGLAKSYFSTPYITKHIPPIRLAYCLSQALDYPLAISIEASLKEAYGLTHSEQALTYNAVLDFFDACPDELTMTLSDGLLLNVEKNYSVHKDQLKELFKIITIPEHVLSCDEKYEKLISLFS